MTDPLRPTDPTRPPWTTYRAVADADRARAVAGTESPFAIEVHFLGGLTDTQQAAFATAADRWTRVIVGDLPDVTSGGETIDDVRILAQGTDIDGVGGVLGQAGPTVLRPAAAGPAALLPAEGVMYFDTADLAQMERDGTLGDVITHEMGHVLGIGTIWRDKGLLQGSTTIDPRFTGAGAAAEFGRLRAAPGQTPVPIPVPVENTGGPGTRLGHWREAVFGTELMSGFISGGGNPISLVTVASLADVGYQVDPAAAEPYALPETVPPVAVDTIVAGLPGVLLPVIPRVLPASSLRGAG